MKEKLSEIIVSYSLVLGIRLELFHHAETREVFLRLGALRAAKWIVQSEAGSYSQCEDVLGFEMIFYPHPKPLRLALLSRVERG